MSISRSARPLAGLLLVLTPAVASAQLWDTGIAPWTVRYDLHGMSVSGPELAPRVNPRPSYWQANDADHSWIGASESGTLPGGALGDNTSYRYLFSTTINALDATRFTYVCAVDNPVSFLFVDASPVKLGGCGQNLFGSEQTFDLAPGRHTVAFDVEGDGVTDGLLVNFQSAVVITPEPASLTLLATGLVGMVGAARRRQRRNS